jgi:hypothetical protein
MSRVSAIAAVPAALTLMLAAAAPALAGVAAADEPVVWSVAPADASGPDGRAAFELEISPGVAAIERLAVRNGSNRDAVFAIQAADGYHTAAGRFNMLSDPADSVDAGTWIEVVPRVEVPAGGMVVVPFEVRVPADAEPGDHAAGIAAAVGSDQSVAPGEAGVGVVSRFGIRVMVRVAGDLRPSLEIRSARASFQLNWNPFEAGRLVTWFELANTGNARLALTGTVAAQGKEANWPRAGEQAIELFPGESRLVEAPLRGVWPVFAVKAQINAEPEVRALEGVAIPDTANTETSAWTWAVPWPQLAALAGAALILASTLAGRRRSRRKVAALVETAVAAERARHTNDPPAGQPTGATHPAGLDSARLARPDPANNETRTEL